MTLLSVLSVPPLCAFTPEKVCARTERRFRVEKRCPTPTDVTDKSHPCGIRAQPPLTASPDTDHLKGVVDARLRFNSHH